MITRIHKFTPYMIIAKETSFPCEKSSSIFSRQFQFRKTSLLKQFQFYIYFFNIAQMKLVLRSVVKNDKNMNSIFELRSIEMLFNINCCECLFHITWSIEKKSKFSVNGRTIGTARRRFKLFISHDQQTIKYFWRFTWFVHTMEARFEYQNEFPDKCH